MNVSFLFEDNPYIFFENRSEYEVKSSLLMVVEIFTFHYISITCAVDGGDVADIVLLIDQVRRFVVHSNQINIGGEAQAMRHEQYLVCKVRETGAFADKKRNLIEEKLDDIAACFEQSPHKSLSKLAQQHDTTIIETEHSNPMVHIRSEDAEISPDNKYFQSPEILKPVT
ncbi:hypothetical protein C0J52_20319 [Blattella germanica]|nr:hypothetical protein C0J52_20319 [Blattella germanica]